MYQVLLRYSSIFGTFSRGLKKWPEAGEPPENCGARNQSPMKIPHFGLSFQITPFTSFHVSLSIDYDIVDVLIVIENP